MGSDESHFNVSLTMRDKVTRQCPQTTTFEEKGEPKQIPTEVPLITSLTPYRWAKPAHGGSREIRQTEGHAGRCGGLDGRVWLEEGGRVEPKLQAPVYDILPSFQGRRCRKAVLVVWVKPSSESKGDFEKKKNWALDQLLDWFDLASRRVFG